MDRCACFLTDLGYIFPTLLCAIQARKFLDRESSDVVMIVFDLRPETLALFTEICEGEHIVLIAADRGVLEGYNAMYARLFLSAILPERYSRVFYMDGDIQITGSLNDLIGAELLAGCDFAAAPDPMAIELYEAKSRHPKIQSYFAGIGVSSTPARPYFNGGTLLINRAQWAGIGREAINFITENPSLCLFGDQSSLNAAGHSRFAPMSFKWNFPIFFRNCGVEAPIAPRVFHFMSKPKPWDGNFPPWNNGFVEPYGELLATYPQLRGFTKNMPAKARRKYLAQQYYKRVLETVTWRYSGRRPAILEFEAATRF